MKALIADQRLVTDIGGRHFGSAAED